MRDHPVIEIREPGREVRRVRLTAAAEAGRSGADIELLDAATSRRHVKFVPSPLGLSVVDLGSRNGTFLNGHRLHGRSVLAVGDVLRMGSTAIVVVSVTAESEPDAPVAAGVTVDTRVASSLAPPPPPASPPSPRGPLPAAMRRLLRGGPAAAETLSSIYTELPTRIPRPVWSALQVASVTGYLVLVVAMFVRPAGALFVLFTLIVPMLPLLFFVAPGLWRNVCPLAASNQTPRVFGFSKGRRPPMWLQRRGYVIAASLFFAIAAARLVLFGGNGAATGVLLLVTIATAFAGGVVFQGKSGWCASVCPLLPLQRVYGQTPFVTVPNAHCRPCLQCTKNCYDFKPHPAYQADLADPDKSWSGPRKLFVAALPGFVLGFFVLPGVPGKSSGALYLQLALFVLVSVGSFFVLDAVSPIATGVLAAVYGATAISTFYWFAGPVLAGSLGTITGLDLTWLRWPIQLFVLVAAAVWVSRSYWVERRFAADAAHSPTLLPLTPTKTPPAGVADGSPEVCFEPGGVTVSAEVGISILEVAESAGLAIESGCRMGVCGADPIAVREGSQGLSPPDEDETNTLRRLGLADSTRLACCARMQSGSVTVSLTPDPGDPNRKSPGPSAFDRSIVSVVVLGGGIAGITAADFLRRGHPDCEIHVVGREPELLYNRMGLSRLVYGRSAMRGLQLLDDQWYDTHRVSLWLNTIASRIDRGRRQVVLGTGQRLSFDRLIVATGARSRVPSVLETALPGIFVLREAVDAVHLRAYVQQHHCRTAVIAGGGLLGLEAAFALAQLDIDVTVLERGNRLLSKQIDARASALVHEHFDHLGIRVLYGTVIGAVEGDSRLRSVRLGTADGTSLRCDVVLGCMGVEPRSEIARDAGIGVRRGVLVDDRMHTSAEGIYAAGDVAEHRGRVMGLWPIAAKQGEVAAVNALGGQARIDSEISATILKGVGLELAALGQVDPAAGDLLFVHEDARRKTYRRLVVSHGRVVGAVVLGHRPKDLAAATAAVKRRRVLHPSAAAALGAGDWSVLAAAPLSRTSGNHSSNRWTNTR